MKKIVFLTFCAFLVAAGCTSPEQDEKIKAFWAEQAGNAMMKVFEAKGRFDAGGFSNRMAGALQNVKADQSQAAPAEQPQAAPKPRPAEPQLPRMLEVTLEEEALPGRAPLSERKLMKQALDEVQLDNLATLQDLQTVFGESVKVKAFLITNRTETELKKAAANATTFQAYLSRQEKLVNEQHQAIEQLMQQNKSQMKHLK